MRTKVVILSHAKEMGGAEQSLLLHLRNINLNVFEVILCTPNNSEISKRIKNEGIGIEIYPLQVSSPKKVFDFFKCFMELNKVIKNKKINVVHFNSYRSAFYIPFINVKSKIWHVRDNQSNKLLTNLLCFFADEIILISPWLKHQFPSFVDKKISVINNGVDLSKLDFSHKKKSVSHTDFLILGRLDRWKGIHKVISSFSLIKEDFNFTLRIVGDEILTKEKGYKAELIEMVSSLKLNEKVQMISHTEDIRKQISRADYVINFSDFEPFGRTIIEGFSVGRPAIVKAEGGPKYIVRDKYNGFSLSIGNENQEIEKLSEILKNAIELNPSDHEEMCRNARNTAEEIYDAGKTTKAIEKIYIK